MQATFLGAAAFPPPAARTGVLPRRYGPCTRLAANAGETTVVQHVIGNVVRLYVGLNLGQGPAKERVELDKLVLGIPFQWVQVGTGCALVCPDARYP